MRQTRLHSNVPDLLLLHLINVVRETTFITSLFRTAQDLRPAYPPAPLVSAVTDTLYVNATPISYGTESLELEHDATTIVDSSTQPEMFSASNGKLREAALKGTSSLTNALVAAVPLTERIHVLLQRKSALLTPLKAHAWLETLSRLNLLNRHHTIPNSISYGFRALIPQIQSTFTPKNSDTILQYDTVFSEIVLTEYERGRYLGPFSKSQLEKLIGPFQSSPLSLVPKSNGKYRLVQNLSYPPRISFHKSLSISSINYHIDSNLFPCTWGTFEIVSLLISQLPPGSECASRDVAEAYRRLCLPSNEWNGMPIRLTPDDEHDEAWFAVDTAVCFGLRSGAGLWGMLADALSDILRASGLGPILNWVDDYAFFRILRQYLHEYNFRRTQWASCIANNGGLQQKGSRLFFSAGILPDSRMHEFSEDCQTPIKDLSPSSPRSDHDLLYTYNISDINHITDPLGLPWSVEKDIPFSSKPTYIGFQWDLSSRRVSLTTKKREKYIEATQEWLNNSTGTYTLNEAEQLYGKLLHASQVLPPGRAYLTGLETFLSIARDRPYVRRHPPKRTRQELLWWLDRLQKPSLDRPIPGIISLINIHAYSDASSSTGIAITIGNAWRAWKLPSNWNQQKDFNIGWAEAIGVELLARSILPSQPPESNFLLHCDNQGVVEGWKNGRSQNSAINIVFRRLHSLCEDTQSRIIIQYVKSGDNPADLPSRGIYPSGPLLPAPTIPSELIDKISLVTDEEIYSSAQTPSPGSIPKIYYSSLSVTDNSQEQLVDFATRYAELWNWD